MVTAKPTMVHSWFNHGFLWSTLPPWLTFGWGGGIQIKKPNFRFVLTKIVPYAFKSLNTVYTVMKNLEKS